MWGLQERRNHDFWLEVSTSELKERGDILGYSGTF